MNKITIGCDPELFLENDTEIVSAIGLIKGTKQEPHPISDEGHSIQIDNIAMEFNIPPSNTLEEFKNNVNFVKDHLGIIAKSNNLKISTKASGEINPKYLDHPIAQMFGCDPDFNVYERSINEPPEPDTNLRCVGGHVHIGYPEPNQEQSEKIVKAFDIFVTLPSLLMDDDERRREMYGKAGCFRFKDFGVECRQLSNFWIHDNKFIDFVYNNTVNAVNMVLNNEIDEYIEEFSQEVLETINSNNKENAKLLITKIQGKIQKKHDKININTVINSL